jgi:predicted small metal-binding protein
MREFKCASLGYTCTWKHIATEELLADMAALHLRDVHGIPAVDPELLGRIKKAFSSPAFAEAAEAVAVVMKEYTCDMGPGCTWRYIAMTEDLIADGAAIHAREAHGILEFTPEMIAKVKRSIHAWGEEGAYKKTA